MRVGMAVGIPTTNPRRNMRLKSLSVLGHEFNMMADRAQEFDIYVNGNLLVDYLRAVGIQLQEVVDRNTKPEPEPLASDDEIKRLTSEGKTIEAIRMHRQLYGSSLLDAKRYI